LAEVVANIRRIVDRGGEAGQADGPCGGRRFARTHALPSVPAGTTLSATSVTGEVQQTATVASQQGSAP
jgi:hypothetical protein